LAASPGVRIDGAEMGKAMAPDVRPDAKCDEGILVSDDDVTLAATAPRKDTNVTSVN
jgi:hypothetical protein